MAFTPKFQTGRMRKLICGVHKGSGLYFRLAHLREGAFNRTDATLIYF
jgi:hypothetical protein